MNPVIALAFGLMAATAFGQTRLFECRSDDGAYVVVVSRDGAEPSTEDLLLEVNGATPIEASGFVGRDPDVVMQLDIQYVGGEMLLMKERGQITGFFDWGNNSPALTCVRF